jgi:hypothetical protein
MIREYSKSVILRYLLIGATVTSVHSWLWFAIRWCDIDIQIVTDLELYKTKGLAVIGSSLTRASNSDFSHAICPWSGIWVNQGKIEVSSLSSCIRVNVPNQACQLLKRCVHPGVDLKNINIQSCIFSEFNAFTYLKFIGRCAAM